MKRKIIVLILFCLFLTGCKEETPKKDYSKYLFTDINWTRDSETDIETISFKSDGRFVYYCSCGNSVNDSDLCESYTYDEETNEIKLSCFETTDEMVTTIKIINSTESILELDFNGEIRKFEREK